MAGSSFGNLFRITTFGESHGRGLGVVIDGVPAGIGISEEEIQQMLDRRKPGNSRYATKRAEEDRAEILSGLFEGRTTGTPIGIVVYNADQRSRDYSAIKDVFRPGHADFGFEMKYGFRDYRGGGRSSGRETVARVAAGAVAKKALAELGITVSAYTAAIGDIKIDYEQFDLAFAMEHPLCMPDRDAASRAEALLEACMAETDSAGGIIECIVKGMPSGVGDPVFEKLDANLAKAVMSIGAVKGVEIGDGFAAAEKRGSENNDPFFTREGGIYKTSNHAGGILGGMSDGTDIILRAAVKPTPSIAREQETIDKNGENVRIRIQGRHDPVIVPRAVVVVEAMTAVTVFDALLTGAAARMDNLKKIYL